MNPVTPTAVYYARSDKNPNSFYLVALNPAGFWECACPAATYNRRTPCKHVTRAMRGEALPATPRFPLPPVSRLKAVPSAAGRRIQAGMEV